MVNKKVLESIVCKRPEDRIDYQICCCKKARHKINLKSVVRKKAEALRMKYMRFFCLHSPSYAKVSICS